MRGTENIWTRGRRYLARRIAPPEAPPAATPEPLVEPSFRERLDSDELPRMQYAYPLYHAALQAKRLDIPRITAIEFGVFTGHGLRDLEYLAGEIEREIGDIVIDVVGFDSGQGMPAPADYRDMAYVWQKGFFCIDLPAVKSQLRRSEIVLGDVGDTVHEFVKREPAPIGFISFDLDYYSSTMKAFELLGYPTQRFLPRVLSYFDDVAGDDFELHCEYTAELLAIREFNEQHELRKICPIHLLRNKRRSPAGWNEHIYVVHFFDHPLYNRYINTDKNW